MRRQSDRVKMNNNKISRKWVNNKMWSSCKFNIRFQWRKFHRPNSRVNIWTFRLPQSDGACNLKKDWVLTICCGLHGCDIYLHSGNTGKQLSLKTLAFECNSIEYDIVICDYAINIPVPQSRCCHRLHVSHANASCRGRTLLPQCKHASLSFSRAPFSEAIFSLSILT